MIRFLKSGWMIALLGAAVYLGVTFALLSPARVLRNLPDTGLHEEPGAPPPSWEFVNPEVDRLIAELKKERQALADREKQLAELAARLDAERAEINIVTQAVHQLQREFDRNVTRVKDEEQANLKKLAKVYAAMSPENAATVFKQMEDEQLVKIMVFMKETETAPILESFASQGETEAKRVAAISERLRTALYRPTTAKP
jgi:uncharacterized protein YoxC